MQQPHIVAPASLVGTCHVCLASDSFLLVCGWSLGVLPELDKPLGAPNSLFACYIDGCVILAQLGALFLRLSQSLQMPFSFVALFLSLYFFFSLSPSIHPSPN